MGSEWKEYSLGDLGRIVTGKTPSKRENGNFGDEVPFVTPRDLDGSRNIETTERYLSEQGANAVKNSIIPPNSIAVSCIGSDMGKAAIVKKRSVTNQQINSIILDGDFDFRYVYYVLSTRKQEIRDAAGGSAQPILNKSHFSQLPILIPPLPEQKAIAHILGSLDDKIELNRRMNATLEGMAQALFKSWFVDFDPVLDNALLAGNPIPDEFAERAKVRRQILEQNQSDECSVMNDELEASEIQNSSLKTPHSPQALHPPLSDPKSLFPAAFEETEELGWIPEGWEARAIGDSFQLLGGHSFKSGDYIEDGRFGIVTIKNVQDGSFVQECTNRITEIPGKMKSHCHLNSGDVLLSLTGNVGRVCIVSEGDYLLNQRVSKIVGRDGIPDAFGYFFFRQESLYERMITIAKGTAQQNLSPIETAKLEQVMPSNQTIAELSQRLREFHAKMVGNTAQSQTLTKLRDTLLPKLISGELRLDEASQRIEAVLT